VASGYNRIKPVMPHKSMVPAGAPAELRLDARKEDVIPLYPY
jgi:cholesterol oxidase